MKKRLIGIVAVLTLLFVGCGGKYYDTKPYRTDEGKICVHIQYQKQSGFSGNWKDKTGGLKVRSLSGEKEYNVNGEYCKVSK